MWLPVLALLLVLAALPYLTYIGLRWLLVDGDRPVEPGADRPPVSILVPTYNEAAIVENTLERLCSLEYPQDRLEVVIVDSSTDDTAERVRSFFAERATPTLELVEEETRGGVARAVNAGVEAASHDVIFRTDCDSRLDPSAIERAVETLADPAVGAVTGRQADVLGESRVEESYRDLQAGNQALETALDSTFIVHGPCFAFEREYFEPLSTDSLADDTAIAVAIRKRGKRVVMDPTLLFAEAGTSDIRGRRLRKDRRAMGLIQVLTRNRDLLGRYGRYGRVVVPFNWFFLVFSPWFSVLIAAYGVLAVGATVGIPAAVGVMIAGVGLVGAGHTDRLGPLQPVYAVVDSQLSLLVASCRLLAGGGDGTWEVDADSREHLE